ncbi:MAG TPA: hypothetical protein VGI40_09770 [Pirellulaceae bacterium]|jgi:hypothetical protein
MRSTFQTAFCLLISLTLLSLAATADETASDIFSRRILPLAKADKPSSCAECHAAGVDLSQYIKSDAATTFAALRAAGLVNAEQPEKSKLLEFIALAPEKGDASIAKLRAEELAAFRTWITAAAKDPQIASAPFNANTEQIGPTLPPGVIRHARRDRVLASFMENIWIERERCAGCHSPDKNQRLIKEHGEQISWIVPNDPAATLATIIDHGLVNLADPRKSKILQKPLGEVEHGGHIKFTYGTRTDKQFRRFLDDYAATVSGQYLTAADLPKQADQVVVATAQHLRMTDMPTQYGTQLVRIDLHRWTDSGWSRSAVASVDGRMNPKTATFQGVVFVTLPRTVDIAKEVETRRQLPGGRYLAKLYIDKRDNAAKNRDYELGAGDFIGQVEFDGPWPPGYSPPKIIKAPVSFPEAQ